VWLKLEKQGRNRLVLIAGGSSSGKTTLTRKLAERLGNFKPTIVTMDNYYRDLSGRGEEFYRSYDFDDPAALDENRFADDLGELLMGSPIEELKYDFATHSRSCSGQMLEPSELILAEGIFILCSEQIRALADLMVFIDVSEETMFRRRMERDASERGRSSDSISTQFYRFVIPAQRKFVSPCAEKSDIVLHGEDGIERNVIRIEEEILKRLKCADQDTLCSAAKR
jgi:uridine kinase